MALKEHYDARQKNLGTEPPDESHVWRRRLLLLGSLVLAVAALVAGYAMWWNATHLRVVRAVVCAAVVSLSSEVDARMQERLVRPGDRVEKGQLLARLDDSAQAAALAAAEAEAALKESLYQQAERNAALIEAGVASEVAVARTRLEMADARARSAEALLEIRRAKAPAEVRRATARRDEALAHLRQLERGLREEVVEAAKARLATASAREALAALQVQQMEELVARNIESPIELEVRKTELVARQNETREAQLRLQQLVSGATTDEIEAARQALAVREAELEAATEDEKTPEILEADLATRRAELREAEEVLRQAKAGEIRTALAREQVKAAEADLAKARAEVEVRRAVLRGMSFYSPVSGVVLRTFDSEGELCRKGVPTILVVDESRGWWVEGFVREWDAQRVRPGQRVKVSLLSGARERVFATVSEVGLSTSAIGRDRPGSSATAAAGGDAPGLVWVKLSPEEPAPRALPGMSAEAVIRVR